MNPERMIELTVRVKASDFPGMFAVCEIALQKLYRELVSNGARTSESADGKEPSHA